MKQNQTSLQAIASAADWLCECAPGTLPKYCMGGQLVGAVNLHHAWAIAKGECDSPAQEAARAELLAQERDNLQAQGTP